MSSLDATVVGSGPNGLAAAVELARAGLDVLLVEASGEIGGGLRTEELTLPGYRHDVCSAIHPTGVASPFFNEIGLEVDWIHSEIPMTHPLDDGNAVALYRSFDETAESLGEDESTYRSIMGPTVENIEDVLSDFLSPLTFNPDNKRSFLRTATLGALPASVLAQRFSTEQGKALIAGLAAHSIASFNAPATAAVGLLLGAIAHTHGWPMARGGSAAIAEALGSEFEQLGGRIETGRHITSPEDVESPIVVLDVMPPAALAIGGHRVEPSQQRRLRRWSPGAGVFKIDWALREPIPWRDPLSRRAATVHVGGTFDEVATAERSVARGKHSETPFVLLAQQSQFDLERVPGEGQTAWAYCHVPNGSTRDMTDAIEDQVERFAPGFKDLVLARSTKNTVQYQQYNPNIVGGDIGGGQFGLQKILQLGAKRPYQLGDGIYLCSSATPPGAGVHGMCGYHAARAALSG